MSNFVLNHISLTMLKCPGPIDTNLVATSHIKFAFACIFVLIFLSNCQKRLVLPSLLYFNY